MSAIVSQITSLTIVYSTIYSRRRSKKTSKLRITGLCEENSPVTGEFPAQMASNVENVSIWWRHHDLAQNGRSGGCTENKHRHTGARCHEKHKRRCAFGNHIRFLSSVQVSIFQQEFYCKNVSAKCQNLVQVTPTQLDLEVICMY